MVAGSLATGCVAGPAVGRHPLLAVPGSVGMNRDQADILLAQLPAPGVHTFGAGPESYSSGVTKEASKPRTGGVLLLQLRFHVCICTPGRKGKSFPDAENHILSKGCRRVFNGA